MSKRYGNVVGALLLLTLVSLNYGLYTAEEVS